MNVRDLVDQLETLKPKRLRTIRNSINNRLSAIAAGKDEKLAASHPLYDIDQVELKNIKAKIEKILSKITM